MACASARLARGRVCVSWSATKGVTKRGGGGPRRGPPPLFLPICNVRRARPVILPLPRSSSSSQPALQRRDYRQEAFRALDAPRLRHHPEPFVGAFGETRSPAAGCHGGDASGLGFRR